MVERGGLNAVRAFGKLGKTGMHIDMASLWSTTITPHTTTTTTTTPPPNLITRSLSQHTQNKWGGEYGDLRFGYLIKRIFDECRCIDVQ